MITLYHGSNIRITNIDLSQCHPYKDFGQAFYLTTVKEQAMDVAEAIPLLTLFVLMRIC